MTDTQLLEAFVERGDRSAFDALVARHYGHVYHVALHLVHSEFDARDVAQNVFVRALKHADQVRDPTRFRAWLLRITVNEVRQQRRRRKPPTPVDQLQLAFEDTRGPSAEKEASRREFEIELEKALLRMPEHLKVPLVLHYYQSLSMAEVAAILEMPKSTVQHRIEKAVRFLRRRFRAGGQAALLPFLAAHVPSSSAASTSLSSGLVVGGALAVKTYVALIVALLLVLFVVVRPFALFERVEEPERRDASRPSAEEKGAREGRSTASLRGREDALDPAAEALAGSHGPSIHSEGPGRIVGHVMALEGGRGVAGVRITLTLSSATDEDLGIAPFENRYVSGTDGSFLCDQLPLRGVYTLLFHHPHHAYAELLNVAFPRAQTEMEVGAVLLDHALVLGGIVVDAAGAPLSGVTIRAGHLRRGPWSLDFRYREGMLNGARATSGADGRFQLTRLAAGYHCLQAFKPGYASLGMGSVHVGSGAGTPLRLTMAESRPIDGIVVDHEGRPVSDARVEVGLLEHVNTGTQGFVRVVAWGELRTDEAGRFCIDDFPETPGASLSLDVGHPDHASFHETYYERPADPLRITIAGFPTVVGVSVALRLFGEDGRALDGVPGTAFLSLESDEFDLSKTVTVNERTGEAGFTDVPPGSHYLSVELLGFRPRAETIVVAEAPLVLPLTFERGALASGRVVDAVTGDPVPGAVISTSEVNRAVADEEGRFELRGLRGGIRQNGAVTVSAPGYLDARPPLPFRKGEQSVEIEVPLWSGTALRSVEGLVLDGKGRPVAGASLALRLASPTVYHVRARTTIDGSFAFRSVVPAHMRSGMRIRTTHPAYAPNTVRVTPDDLERPLRLTLDHGRRIRGYVVDETGRPVADVFVGVVSTDQFGVLEGHRLDGDVQHVDSLAGNMGARFVATTRADSEGGFLLDRVPTDALQVLAYGASTRWLIEDGQTGARVEGGAADAGDVVVRVLRGWTVSGRVEDPLGRPLAGLGVRVPESRAGARTNADGLFAVAPVFGDAATVVLTASDYFAYADVTPATSVGLRIVATPCGAVKGRIVDAAGKGVGGVSVRIRVDELDLVRERKTDEEGRFELRRVPVGARTLEVEGVSRREVEVALGIETDLGPLPR